MTAYREFIWQVEPWIGALCKDQSQPRLSAQLEAGSTVATHKVDSTQISALTPRLKVQVVAVEVLGPFRDRYLMRIFSSGGIQSDNTF